MNVLKPDSAGISASAVRLHIGGYQDGPNSSLKIQENDRRVLRFDDYVYDAPITRAKMRSFSALNDG